MARHRSRKAARPRLTPLQRILKRAIYAASITAAAGAIGVAALHPVTAPYVQPLTASAIRTAPEPFKVWATERGMLAQSRPAAMPDNFDDAKSMLREQVYYDIRVEDYCDCRFDSRLQIDASCPLVTPLFEDRQRRVEWEHINPASDFGRQRSCWRSPPEGVSGRAWCRETDPAFAQMEADPHNLIPTVGALNAIRLNHRYGMVTAGQADRRIQGCEFAASKPGGDRFIEPPDRIKGLVARVYLYMEDRYQVSLSRSQKALFQAWDRQFPPSAYEVTRNQRIARATGVSNPFVE